MQYVLVVITFGGSVACFGRAAIAFIERRES